MSNHLLANRAVSGCRPLSKRARIYATLQANSTDVWRDTPTRQPGDVQREANRATRAVELPLDWYKVLQLDQRAGIHSIRKAYERLLNSTHDTLYSQVRLPSANARLLVSPLSKWSKCSW
jgi:DnaJ-domain-containing protein 1